MNELIRIDQDGRITARELYEFLELDQSNYAKWCRVNIMENEFSEEGKDWRLLVQQDEYSGRGQKATDYHLSIDFAKKLCMVSKSFKGEAARNYFIEVEKRYSAAPKLPMLTPTQIIAAVAQQLADQEQRQILLETRTEKVENTLTLVKDTIVQRPDGWRESMNSMIAKIVEHSADNDFQSIRADSYEILEQRAGCDLNTRLRNHRFRLEEVGATKTNINKANKMDIIESDKRLKEIYTSIVKELTIRYVS